MSRRLQQQMFRATRSLRASGINAGEGGSLSRDPRNRPTGEHKKLMREIRKDPEIYLIFALTAATVGAYGYYQPHFWAAIAGQTRTTQIEGTKPWEDGAEGSTGKYRYQTRAGPGKEVRTKDAPSALNSVIVPNVNLPRKLHEKYNKWGKEDFDEY